MTPPASVIYSHDKDDWRDGAVIECATCIHEREIITQIKRMLDDLGIPGEFLPVYGAIQECAQKYNCPDHFPRCCSLGEKNDGTPPLRREGEHE